MLSDDEEPSLKSPRVESTDDTHYGSPNVETVETAPAAWKEASVQPEVRQADSATKQRPTTAKKDTSRKQSNLVKPINKARALRKSYYDPRTIARDVLIASGRHPTERGLNHHLLKLREKFSAVDFHADLETFRWDQVDPGGPTRPEVHPVPLLTRSQPASQEQTGQTALPNPVPRDPASVPLPATSTASPSLPTKKTSGLRTSHVAEHDDTSKRSSPLLNMSLGTASSSHRVRKSSARKSASTTASTSTSTPSRTYTRYPQVQVVISMLRHSPTPYAVYECHWQHCGATLHNLATLRKHLLRVHVPVEEDEAATACHWDGCCENGKTWDRQALSEHLESHVSEVAWVKGEGPSATLRGTPRDESGENTAADTPEATPAKATGGSVASPIVIV